MSTVYKPDDELFERCTYIGKDYRATPIVRAWTVLSVVLDPLYKDEYDQPLQVVTLRAFTPERALYKAEIAPFLDIAVSHGTWHRTEHEAHAALDRAVGGIVGKAGVLPP